MKGKQHFATSIWTPSTDYYLRQSYGKTCLQSLTNTLNVGFKSIIWRAQYLGIDTGTDSQWSLDELQELSAVIQEHGTDIEKIREAYPDKKISSIYKTIERLKEYSSLPDMKMSNEEKGRKNFEHRWTDDELKYLDGVIDTFPKRANDVFRAEICKKLPNHSWAAIKQRVYTIKQNRKAIESVARQDAPKVKINTPKEPIVVNKAPLGLISNEAKADTPVLKEIFELVKNFNKTHLAASKVFKVDGVIIQINISRNE